MLFLLSLSYKLSPETQLTSNCDRVFESPVLFDSQCVYNFSYETTIDLQNYIFNVLSLPLDESSCARYLLKLNNTVLKNAIFALNLTVEHSWVCRKQVVGIFDTLGVTSFRLENINVKGNVFLEKDVEASVGGIFAYYGMLLPAGSQTTTSVINARNSGDASLQLILHNSNSTLNSLFNQVGYSLQIFRLNSRFYNVPIVNRLYLPSEVTNMASYLASKVAFNDSELTDEGFAMNYYKFEAQPAFIGKQADYQAGFTIYKGTYNEFLPIAVQSLFVEASDAHIPGIKAYMFIDAYFDSTKASQCLDAQRYAKGKLYSFTNISYEIMGNVACNGCDCIVCSTLLVAKPEFEKVYCTVACPGGTYEFDNACVGTCPNGFYPDRSSKCVSMLCPLDQYFDLASASCRDGKVDGNPYPKVTYTGPHGEIIRMVEETEFLKQCPYHLNTQCFTSCPPGYQNIEDPFGVSYYSTTCINCWDLGYHGWKDGKCHSACPLDMVSENGICVDKCSDGYFDNDYFCLRRCKSGFAYYGKCVSECPNGYVVGRDYRGCFHSCPSNMHMQDGVCVMTCDYGMEYNSETLKCEMCNSEYREAWNGEKCVQTGTHECPYYVFKDGIVECTLGCDYGQIQHGTLCVSIDTAQGDFAEFDACPFMSNTEIWTYQFYCKLNSTMSNFMGNILSIHEVSDCNYAVLDMDGGSISDSVFFVNLSMAIPSQCADEVNISIFLNAQSLTNVKLFGTMNFTGVSYDAANIGVAASGTITGLTANVNITVSGLKYTLRQLTSTKGTPAPLFEDIAQFDPQKREISRGGNLEVIYTNNANFNLTKLLKVLEFFDDMDNSTVSIQYLSGGRTVYITSSVQPKMLSSDYEITDCSVGTVVECSDASCTCKSTLGTFLYGVFSVSNCPSGTYSLDNKCYDVCPPGYGASGSSCVQCTYYSFEGVCVESCTGSTFGKQCYFGGLKPGYIQLDQYIIKCGQEGSSPYYESGMCVEKCSSSTVNSDGICLSKCPYGSYKQYKESTGQSECVLQCDYGFYEQDFECIRNCTDNRFRQYKECRYDCSNSIFKDLCISNNCDIGYMTVNDTCVACKDLEDGRVFYVFETGYCSATCAGAVILINGVQTCCTENDTSSTCMNYVMLNQVNMHPSYFEGTPEQDYCYVMQISNIWDAAFCDITPDSNQITSGSIYNIIGMQLVQQTAATGEVSCRYSALDVNAMSINNILINVDVVIDIPPECSKIEVGVFGTVAASNISYTTIYGTVEFLHKSPRQSITGRNVLNNLTNSIISLYTEFEINNVFTLDFANGVPYEEPNGLEVNSIKYRFGDFFHSVSYVGDDSESLLAQFYKGSQYVYDVRGLLQHYNVYQSIRPLGWNGVDVIQCHKNYIIDQASKECGTGCGAGQKLLGTSCFSESISGVREGQNANQFYFQCPYGTAISQLTGRCEACPLNKYIELDSCVNSCSDGMLLYGRYCVSACPLNYRQVGQFCQQSDSSEYQANFILEAGVEVSACPDGSAAIDGICQGACLPGQFMLNGACSLTCDAEHYVLDGACLPFPAGVEKKSVCPEDHFLTTDDEGINRCVKSCPNNKWAVNGECVDTASCNDPMSYKSETSRRCIPCYVKNSPSETEKCQACTSINRTDSENKTRQYCTQCNFFYTADTQIGLETKFCTDQCPPNPNFLTAEENLQYSTLRFPFSMGSGATQQIECRENCGPDKFAHELTQTYYCSYYCSGGYISNVPNTGTLKYKRCLKSCGAYPNENPVLPKYKSGETICGTKCNVANIQAGAIYRYKPEGDDTWNCGTSCPAGQTYHTEIDGDILCSKSCSAGYYATPYVVAGVFKYYLCQQTCTSTDAQISANVFYNDANQSCVKGCENSLLYDAVYLSGQRCVTSCDYYQEYTGNDHAVQYQCTYPCDRYYVDPDNRKVCVASCPSQLKYVERDAAKRSVCVSHCSNDSMLIASGVCGTSCPDVYFKTETVYDNGVKYLNRICILQQQCLPPLATETVITIVGKLTHCTYCNIMSLNGNSYTHNGSCVPSCPNSYDEDLNCMDSCGITDSSGAYYASENSTSKKCVKNCFRDSSAPTVCKADNRCPNYVSAADPYVCVDSCNSGSTRHLTLDNGVVVKVCESNCPGGSEGGICYPSCGYGYYVKMPYRLEGYGCVDDCYAYGGYYPLTEKIQVTYCTNHAGCGENASTTNTSTYKGICKAATNCTKYYITLSGQTVHRCLKSCPLLPAVVADSGEIRCEYSLSGSNYMQFNYYHRAYQVVASSCPSTMVTNAQDRICLDPCPMGKHKLLNGTCMTFPQCTKGTAIKPVLDEDGETVLSYICQSLGSDTYYYYFDGVQYITEDTCEPVWAGSMECKIIDCPSGYYYLHGACTKLCQNSTEKSCIDVVAQTNIFKNNTFNQLVGIKSSQCDTEAGYKLVAHLVGGTVIFICSNNMSSSSLLLSDKVTAVHLQAGFRCAVFMEQTYLGKMFVQDFCASPTQVQVYESIAGYTDNPLKIAKPRVTMVNYRKPLYTYMPQYNMFYVSQVCSYSVYIGKFCYVQCSSNQISLANEPCVDIKEPSASSNLPYVVVEGVKHQLESSVSCVSYVDDYECAVFSCPTITEIDSDGAAVTTKYYYHEGICTTGCVLGHGSNCQKFSKGNIFDSQKMIARNISDCQTLVMVNASKALAFQCSQAYNCPAGYFKVQDRYCVLQDKIAGKLETVFKYEISSPPTHIDNTTIHSPLECQVYKTFSGSNSSSSRYNLCQMDYKNDASCAFLTYNTTLKMFVCSNNTCLANTYDYLSQGLCFAKCDSETGYLVEGNCVTLSSGCSGLYNANGTCNSGETSTTPWSRSGANKFALSFNVDRTYAVSMATNEFQGLVCPSQTHYYFRNACFKRCAIATAYQCQENPYCSIFNSTLECNSTITDSAYLSLVDFGHNTTAKETMAINSRCSSSQISLGRYCIQKSFIEKKIKQKNCVLTIGENESLNEDNLESHCTDDIIECSTYVEVNLSIDSKIRICGHRTEQFDCTQGYYQLDEDFYRFKCVSTCSDTMQVSGRFCIKRCDTDSTPILYKCTVVADCEDCPKYTVAAGHKFKLNESKLSYAITAADGSTEYAYFACPSGFYYLDNRCQQLCPHMAINATIGSKTTQIDVCSKQCSVFYSNGECQQECPSYFYYKMQYIKPYIFYLCEEQACLSSEFTIQSDEAGIIAPLCLPKTISSDYDEIPAGKVFKYDLKAKYWDDMFVGNSECSTFFVSPLDAKLPICADVLENKPDSIVNTLQFVYDYQMFQYRACTFGYQVIDGACYESQAVQHALILNDKILKGYDPLAKGSYEISAKRTSDTAFYRQGNCQASQYMDPTTSACKYLPQLDTTTMKCEFLYTRAAYNTTNGLANESVYFLVDETLENIYTSRISNISCEVTSIKCPTQIGLYYFENKCLKRCALNINDTENEKRTNCLEFVQRLENGTQRVNSVLSYVEEGVEIPYYEALHGDAVAQAGYQMQMQGQYVIHVLQYGDLSPGDDEIMVKVGSASETMQLAQISSLAGTDCVLGITFDAVYVQDICALSCSTFETDGKYMKCMKGFDYTEEDTTVDCRYLYYTPKINMYECTDENLTACSNTQICEDACSSGSSVQKMIPYRGCAEMKCTGAEMADLASSTCKRIRQQGGGCSGYYIERDGYNTEVSCPVKLQDQDTCQCQITLMPCILNTARYGYDCLSVTTCPRVLLNEGGQEWDCVQKCPAGMTLSINLCLVPGNERLYKTVDAEEHDDTVWLVLLGGMGLLCVLGIIMVIVSFVQYRKANANKALRKSKKDTKAGYHERLSRLAADGKQQAKSQRGKEGSKQAAAKDKSAGARRIY